MLVFELGGRRFGLPVADVRELLRAVAIVPLPGASAAFEGVINLRGRIVPVLDLRARLGLPAKALEPSDHLIVAATSDCLAALRVDRALELRAPGASATEDADAPGLDTGGAGVVAVAGLSDGLVPVLDLADLLRPIASLAPSPGPAAEVEP